MLCNPTVVSCPGRRCRIRAVGNRFSRPLKSKMQSSASTIRRRTNVANSTTDLSDHERLDLASMGNVRPNTQINHWPATVNGGR